MKKIFTSKDISLIGFYKEILEKNGINTLIKNYYLASGVGELPPNNCIPELWIIDDDKEQQALAFLKPDDSQHASWQCKCGEIIDAQFSQCWNCGKSFED